MYSDGRVGSSQPPAPTPTFGDALDASRGMVALSQDLTPRNIYGPRGTRASADSYGFPTAHSSASSISSGGNYPYYSASVGSVDSSVTDYSSTTSESYESRTLPRPASLLAGSAPSGPQSMMSQFSSKMPSNTQKKHKCKVCDKRFTRPSSLQTHMYSHTGEKRKWIWTDICWGRVLTALQHLPATSRAVGDTSPWYRICGATRRSTRARKTAAPLTKTSNLPLDAKRITFGSNDTFSITSALLIQSTRLTHRYPARHRSVLPI